MDKNVWRVIRAAIRSADRSIPRAGRTPTYSDRLIVKMYFWVVAHDRPLCWACDRANYNSLLRPHEIPSVSQFCKRLKSERIEAMIRRVFVRLAARDQPADMAFIDGKALPISESSKDPDARTGRGNGRFSRGYKLHALADSACRIRAFCMRPMNEGEPPIAREHLVEHIPREALVMADGNYDGKALYSAVVEQGAALLTPIKKNRRSAAAYRNTSPARQAAMGMWREYPDEVWALYGKRAQIERVFSALSCCGGGLGPLPAWVRRLERVTRWVTAKIALYNARVSLRKKAS